MFREMRRFKQLLSREDTEAILRRGTNGVLSVIGDDGYPYGVPISYAYEDGRIYCHSAAKGHKLDAIAQNEKVCFTVVDQDQVVAEELTSYFRSVIAFGKAHTLKDPEEKMRCHMVLSDRYAADFHEKAVAEMMTALNHMEMIVIDIEHMTGKEAIELVRARKQK